jgi:anaerobic selenocysteine-containing dehydrogenase
MGKAIKLADLSTDADMLNFLKAERELKVLDSPDETHPSVFYILSSIHGDTPLHGYKVNCATLPESDRQRPKHINGSSRNIIYSSDAMCPSECGIKVVVENGKATKIYGNPHSLINNGTLCAKGASGLQLTYSPHRIKKPMIRTGDRGEERWREVSWAEAADYVARELIRIKKMHGPESVVLDCGDVTDREAYYRLFHAFGTPNTFDHGSICDPNRRWGHGLMTGDERPLPDIQRPFLTRDANGKLLLKRDHDIRLLLNIGTNPLVATRFNYMSYGIPGARKEKGCKYIVVDPAYTNSAAHADIWMPITPGTDSALLAAMLLFIINNDDPDDKNRSYIDHDFIKKYTTGWKEFKESFLSLTHLKDPSNGLFYFSAEWASQKTGLKAEQIREISHLIGITKPAAIEIGMHGTSHHYDGDVASILMTTLCLVTGNMDRPGGLVFCDTQKAKKGTGTAGRKFLDRSVTRTISGREAMGRLSELHKDHYGKYPAAWKGVLSDLPRNIMRGVTIHQGPFKGLRYPLKAFISRAGNPVMTAGNTSEWIDAITARDKNGNYLLELSVFIDTHLTDTGKYADLILPEAGFLERIGVSDVYTMSPEIAIRDRAIKPLYESKSPFGIMHALSEALIQNGDPDINPDDFRKYRGEEDFINEVLSEAPGFYNLGDPLPYPDLPEGCLITGTPDNPIATMDGNVIRDGELLTVDWLRRNNGVAVWPAGYFRYRKTDGSPSGVYPRTGSGMFEFRFSYMERINKRFNTSFPVTFYWNDSRFDLLSSRSAENADEYNFRLISGRSHHAMTMTAVCPFLAETETECMKPLNDEFDYQLAGDDTFPEVFGIPSAGGCILKRGTISIPVFAINSQDGISLKIKTGDTITLQSPDEFTIRGKAYLSDEIMPGVIKTAFGPGGRNASGSGLLKAASGYTPNINMLLSPECRTPLTGMPCFGDIRVRIIK